MSIEVKNLKKSFKDKVILDDVSFKVEDGEILAVVGLSGAGKSTILKLICGLTKPDSGEIIVSPGDIAMVFQYSALFDSLTNPAIAPATELGFDFDEIFKISIFFCLL